MIEIPNRQRPAWHGRARQALRQCGVEFPVSLPIPEINLNPCALISEQNQVEMTIPVEIG